MKVQGPGNIGKTGQTQNKKKAGGGGGSFGDMVSAGADQPAATTTTQSIAQVDALLAIQGAEDPTARAAKKRMRHRAEGILDGLEKIRMAMLSGTLTVGHMVDIADVVASHREKISDPSLTGIMDEVDLRAQVELAKMRVAIEKQKQTA